LEVRKAVYNMEDSNSSKFEQIAELKKYREEKVLARKLPLHILQVVVEESQGSKTMKLQRLEEMWKINGQ